MEITKTRVRQFLIKIFTKYYATLKKGNYLGTRSHDELFSKLKLALCLMDMDEEKGAYAYENLAQKYNKCIFLEDIQELCDYYPEYENMLKRAEAFLDTLLKGEQGLCEWQPNYEDRLKIVQKLLGTYGDKKGEYMKTINHYEPFSKLQAALNLMHEKKGFYVHENLAQKYNACIFLEDVQELCDRHPEYENMLKTAKTLLDNL